MGGAAPSLARRLTSYGDGRNVALATAAGGHTHSDDDAAYRGIVATQSIGTLEARRMVLVLRRVRQVLVIGRRQLLPPGEPA